LGDFEDVTDFLFGFLCPPARDYEKDLEALRKIVHEPGDLDAWKKTLAWYVKHGGPKDPVSFVRSRFLSYRHPKDCLKEWDTINGGDDGCGGWLNIVKGETHEQLG
jgi:hypothetical protein